MAERLKGFISYSTADTGIAAEMKVVLQELGVDAFMAHDDIHVSQTWRDRILHELATTQVFVPLLSEAFKSSEWASQEIGVAVSRQDVLIIPVSLDGTIPYGFISALQGKRLPSKPDVDFFVPALVRSFPRTVLPILIERLAGARSFRGAEALFRPLLEHLDQLDRAEAIRLAEAATENGEIWDAGLCRTQYLPEFLRKNRHQLPPHVLTPLEYQIDNGSWYVDDDEEIGFAGHG
jgi:hypothetical protein